MIPMTSYIIKNMGKAARHKLAAQLAGKPLYGAAAESFLGKALRGNIVTNGLTVAVLSANDVWKVSTGQQSTTQTMKNVTKTTSSVVGGAVGWSVGGATATFVIASSSVALGPVGTLLATGGLSLVGSLIGGIGAEVVTSAVLDQIAEDDAVKMMKIINTSMHDVAPKHLVSESEFTKFAENLNFLIEEKNFGQTLRKMYQSNNSKKYAEDNILMPLIKKVVSSRKLIEIPENQTYAFVDVLSDSMKSTLHRQLSDEGKKLYNGTSDEFFVGQTIFHNQHGKCEVLELKGKKLKVLQKGYFSNSVLFVQKKDVTRKSSFFGF